MSESNGENGVNGNITHNGDNDETKISNQDVDMTYENPFVKFVRGFSNVPDESVRKMRFESFPCLLSEYTGMNEIKTNNSINLQGQRFVATRLVCTQR